MKLSSIRKHVNQEIWQKRVLGGALWELLTQMQYQIKCLMHQTILIRRPTVWLCIPQHISQSLRRVSLMLLKKNSITKLQGKQILPLWQWIRWKALLQRLRKTCNRLISGRNEIHRIQIKTRVLMIVGRAVNGMLVIAIKAGLYSVINASHMDIWHLNVRILQCHVIMDGNFWWSRSKGSMCMFNLYTSMVSHNSTPDITASNTITYTTV